MLIIDFQCESKWQKRVKKTLSKSWNVIYIYMGLLKYKYSAVGKSEENGLGIE